MEVVVLLKQNLYNQNSSDNDETIEKVSAAIDGLKDGDKIRWMEGSRNGCQNSGKKFYATKEDGKILSEIGEEISIDKILPYFDTLYKEQKDKKINA